MTDMVFAPLFAELDSEREVVLEEIAMYEDTPQELVHDLFSEAVFGDHPLGRPVIGTADVISIGRRRALAALPPDDVRAGNIVVAAAGNLEHDELVALLEQARASAGGDAPARAPRARAARAGRRRRASASSARTPSSTTSASARPGIARSDRRRFAASLLDAILGGSASSRLFQEIREKRGMAYAVYSFASQYTDTGLIGFYVGTREENLADCVEIAAEQIADIAAGNAARGRARAREGEPQGTHHALDGVDVEPDEPARQVARSPTPSCSRSSGSSPRSTRSTPEAVAELAGVLLAPERLSAAGIGPSEERFRDAVGGSTPELPARAAA